MPGEACLRCGDKSKTLGEDVAEERARGKPPPELTAIRQANAKPIFDDLETWLGTQLTRISGKAPLASAMVIIPKNHWVENWTSPAFDVLGEPDEEIKIYGKPDPGSFEAG